MVASSRITGGTVLLPWARQLNLWFNPGSPDMTEDFFDWDVKHQYKLLWDSLEALCCVLEHETLSSAKHMYWINPERQENVPTWQKNGWLGRKASSQPMIMQNWIMCYQFIAIEWQSHFTWFWRLTISIRGWTQQAQNLKTTSYQCQCDVKTSHLRWYDVVSMSCACWEKQMKNVWWNIPSSWIQKKSGWSIYILGNPKFHFY